MEKTMLELIQEALKEAHIMEQAMDEYDEDHMLLNAMRLSGAPFSFVQHVQNLREN